MRSCRAILLILSIISTITVASAETYQVDTVHSSVKFKIRCLMLGNVTGKFKQFSGYYKMQKGKLDSFVAECHTGSINTGNSKRDKDLSSTGFFDSAHFPIMTMRMIRARGKTVWIKLTIKGITKQVPFIYLSKTAKSNQAHTNQAGFILKGQIYLKDFKLSLNETVGAKSVALGKKVGIIADIKGSETSISVEKFIVNLLK